MSVAKKLRTFAWNPNASVRSVLVIASLIVLVIALIGIAR